jgi:uncharacterized membrane protein (UPF0127 family)
MIEWQEKMDAVIASKKMLQNMNVIDINFTDGRILEVYVAISRQEKAKGLQSIPYLDVDGMIFAYDKPSLNPFTMKDVGFDLDVGWYDLKGILLKKSTYASGSEAPMFSPKPYCYVIETLAGNLPESDLKVADV